MRHQKRQLTFIEAAKAILEEMKQPMHFKKITELALQKKYLVSKGKTPEWTMGARLSVDVKEKGPQSDFVRYGNGKYGLRRWRKSTLLMPTAAKEAEGEAGNYWLVSVEPENFEADVKAGTLDTIGVKYRMRRTLASLKLGDIVVIYIKCLSQFGASMEVDGEPYFDESERWPVAGSELCSRVSAKPVMILKEEHYLDARPLYSSLYVFNRYPEKHRTLALRNGITEISKSDFLTINKSMIEL
jgi:hypothetical protein